MNGGALRTISHLASHCILRLQPMVPASLTNHILRNTFMNAVTAVVINPYIRFFKIQNIINKLCCCKIHAQSAFVKPNS